MSSKAGHVALFNYGSGTALTAVGSRTTSLPFVFDAIANSLKDREHIVGNPFEPADIKNQWSINVDRFAPLTPRVVSIESVGVPGNVLDLAGALSTPGTPILSWPGKVASSPNQIWWLQKYA